MDYDKTLLDASQKKHRGITLSDGQENGKGKSRKEILLETSLEQEKKEDYDGLVNTLEEYMTLEPSASDVAYNLAKTYKKAGNLAQAMQWYDILINDFIMFECEEELLEIYLTGIAGDEKKAKAETYFKEKNMTEEDRERIKKEQEEAKKKAELIRFLDAGKEEYPEAFVKELTDFMQFEKEYLEKMSRLKKQVVPEKKGFIFTNQKEIDKIKAYNEEVDAAVDSLIEERKVMLENLKNEKEVYGVKGKFFFEYPDLRGKTTYRCIYDTRKKSS